MSPDGLLSQVSKAVLERTLEEELTHHLEYDKRDPVGRGSGNSRSGSSAKVLLAAAGAVDLDIPRDRNGEFEPGTVPKGTTRLNGVDDRIVRYMTVG